MKLLKVQEMFELELGKFCYKFQNQILPNQFKNQFTNISSVHGYNTRNSKNQFFQNKQNNKAGFSTLACSGAKLWRKIPEEIKLSKSIYIFTTNYKNCLLQKYQE